MPLRRAVTVVDRSCWLTAANNRLVQIITATASESDHQADITVLTLTRSVSTLCGTVFMRAINTKALIDSLWIVFKRER